MVRTLATGDARTEYNTVGHTTNLAARMQQIARPGSVVVSDGTQKLISAFFDTADLGEMTVKGHAPVRAWEVLRPRQRRSRFDASVERGLTPLAASLLIVIMIGATVISAMVSIPTAIVPFVVGLLLLVIARGRSRAA